MFFPYGPVGSNQSGLDISKHGVNPFEGRFLGGLCAAAGYDWVCVHPAAMTAVKACKSIGNDVGMPDRALCWQAS